MRAFVAGMVGAAFFAVASGFARRAGVEIDLEVLQGSLFTGADDARGTTAYVVGLFAQLLMGGVLGLIYAAILRRSQSPSVGAGAFLGLLHALVAGVLLATTPALHPAVPEVIAAPGILMVRRGPDVAVLFVALHVVFGAWMGLAAVRRPEGEAVGPDRALGTRG